jgi:hypothetical protein
MINHLPPTARRSAALLLFAGAFLLASATLQADTCTQGDLPVTQSWSSGTNTTGATGNLTTSGTVTISGTANITYTAGTSIKLEQNFSALSGATFHARIQTCTPGQTVTVKEYIRLGNRIVAIENHD